MSLNIRVNIFSRMFWNQLSIQLARKCHSAEFPVRKIPPFSGPRHLLSLTHTDTKPTTQCVP